MVNPGSIPGCELYRAASGPYHRLANVSNNVTVALVLNRD
nr:MAG TPA: hypothetical protein [Crassvirales sp.]